MDELDRFELTPNERRALAELPRERAPSPLLEERTRRERDGTLTRLHMGWWQRNERKLAALWRGWRMAAWPRRSG